MIRVRGRFGKVESAPAMPVNRGLGRAHSAARITLR